MGAALVAGISADPALVLSGALVRAGSAADGHDLGTLRGAAAVGVVATASLEAVLGEADVAIDFTPAGSGRAHALACAGRGIPLVVGSTGLGADEERALDAAAASIAVLQSANTSLGVHVLAALVREAARALPASFDIEILDIHHRDKRDAPSGTALLLGRAAAAGRGLGADAARAVARGDGPRPAHSIGYAALRGGDVVGEHSVVLAGNGERLTLSHAATDRAVFARGALIAARFLVGRPAGRYTMADVVAAGALA